MSKRFHFFIFFCVALFSSSAVYSQCLSLSVSTSDVSCFTGNDGAITLTITPGTPPNAQPPFDIELFFRDSEGDITQLALHDNVSFTSITFTPGNGSLNIPGAEEFGIPSNTFIDPGSEYRIQVRSTGGSFVCRDKTAITSVGGPTEIKIDALTPVNPTCEGSNNGEIVINSVSGGSGGPYQYSIDGGATFQASKNFNSLVAGNYSVVILDGTGCESFPTAVTLTSFATVTIDNFTSQNVSCNGGSDGQIVITTVSGGDGGPYQYSIDGGVTFQGSNTFSGLAQNAYDVVVRDGTGCLSLVTTINITEPALPVSGSTTQTDVLCYGESTGSITITGAGGVGPYDFSIDGGTTYAALNAANHTFENLAQGSYSLVVRDANGCASPVIAVTINQPSAALSGSTTQVDVLCFGESTGSVTITGSGGVGPYDFSIDGGGTYTALDVANHTFEDLPAGNYSLVVRDANACTSPAIAVTINEPSTAVSGSTSQVDVLCFGESTGSITITGSGGVAPYDFSIDGGSTYTALDVADYTFTNLAQGDYDLIVRDANGCASPLIEVTINEPSAAVSGSTTQADVLCFGESTGSITITGTGGVAPYDFSIDGGGAYAAVDVANHTFSNLAQGDYDLTVRDANGCVSTVIKVTINEPSAAVGGSTSKVDVVCFGESTGSITITGSGGIAPYDFSIDGGTTYTVLDAANHTFEDLAAGNYSLVVRDANGCASAAIAVTINEPSAGVSGSTSQTDVLCFGESTGSITITGSGGVAPYDFSMDGGSTYPALDAANHTFTNLPQGNYNLIVRDANGCASPAIAVTINEPSDAVSGTTTQTDVTCFGESTGSITITGSGGVSPYDFSMDGGSTYAALDAASHTFSNLAQGTYDLIVRDANGCISAPIQVTIAEPVEVTGATDAVGAVTVCSDSARPDIVFSFTGVAPFDFTYSDGSTSTSITDHAETTYTISSAGAGTYSVTALNDDAGCVATDLVGSVTVTIEPAATVEAGNAQSICTGGVTPLSGSSFGGSATEAVWSIVGQPEGGDGSVSNPLPTTSPSSVDFTATIAGDYTLRLTTNDPAGVCNPASDEVVITVFADPTVDAGPVPPTCKGGTAVLAGSFSGATGITWSTSGDGVFDDASLVNAEYTPGPNDIAAELVTLTITTTGPCATMSEDLTIPIMEAPDVSAGTPRTICSSASLVLNGSSGGSATGLLWTTSGDGTFSDNADPFAEYTPGPNDANTVVQITATATGSCSGTSETIDVPVDPAATVDAGESQTVCDGSDVQLAATIGGAAASMTWTTSGDGSFNNNKAPDAKYTPGPNDIASGSVTLTARTNNPMGPCRDVADNVVITFRVTVTPVNASACKNGPTVDLLTLVSATPAGGTFTFTGAGVTGNTFDPAAQSGTIDVSVNYSVGGCSENSILQITVLDATDPSCGGSDDCPTSISSAISKTNADCTNGGNSGSISVTVNDTGSFMVALGSDQFNEPSNEAYVSYNGEPVKFTQLPRGEYFVYVKSGDTGCPKRSAPINVYGVYDVSFALQADCNDNELSLALVDVTGEVGGAPLEIRISSKLSADPPVVIYEQFPADGEIYLDYDDHVFLKNPGEYRVQVIQYQSEAVCNFASEILDFTVPAQLNAGIGAVAESYPDVPSGKLHVVNFSGGVYPYDVRIELDSAASYSLPFHATDFEEAGINSNQQIEMSYDEIPAGRYIVQVQDSMGCVLDLTARVPLDRDLYIPNVFTPNGDGSNDIFFIRNLPQEEGSNQLVITNRWGKEVFVSENYQNNWDGTGAADGIYFYRLQVSASQSLTGWLEIIRGPKP